MINIIKFLNIVLMNLKIYYKIYIFQKINKKN